MMHQPMPMNFNYNPSNSQPGSQYMSYQSFSPAMMSPMQLPMQPSVQPPMYQLNQPVVPPPADQEMMLNYLRSINQGYNNPLISQMNQQINQPNSQTMNQPLDQSFRPTMTQSINPTMGQTMNQTNNQTISQAMGHVSNVPPAGEVRVSFSSMLSHPQNASVIYYQLRADGHNQDLIIEHPAGWSVVRPQARFVEHLVNPDTNARIPQAKWPMPSPMQLSLKSCNTSRLLPDRAVTRFAVGRASQMEWKEAMKTVKSLKDEEVIRAKMSVSFGLLCTSATPQPPVVIFESAILLGWRTTISNAKRRQKNAKQEQTNEQSTSQASNTPTPIRPSSNQSINQTINQSMESCDGSIPELMFEQPNSVLSTPLSNVLVSRNDSHSNTLGHLDLKDTMNQSNSQSNNQSNKSNNKRSREDRQQIDHAAERIDDLVRSDTGDARAAKRAKIYSEVIIKRPSPVVRPIVHHINHSINQQQSNNQ